MQLKDALKRKNELKDELRQINQKIKELQSNMFKTYSFVALRTAKRKIHMIEDWCCFNLIKDQSRIKLRSASYKDLQDVTGIPRGSDPSEYMCTNDGRVIPKCVLKIPGRNNVKN